MEKINWKSSSADEASPQSDVVSTESLLKAAKTMWEGNRKGFDQVSQLSR